MTTFLIPVLPVLYPLISPFVAYYTLRYVTGVAVDLAIDKTKNAAWYVVTYPFKNRASPCENCKLVCENCSNCNLVCENCKLVDKEKID